MPTSHKDTETDPVKPDAELIRPAAEPVKQDAEAVKPAAEPVRSDAESAKLKVSVPQMLLMHNRQDRLTITLYNFRILASLGVLGFIYHDREFTYNSIVKVGISVCFILFAIGNGAGAVASSKDHLRDFESIEDSSRPLRLDGRCPARAHGDFAAEDDRVSGRFNSDCAGSTVVSKSSLMVSKMGLIGQASFL